MESRAMCFYFLQKFNKKIKIHFRMNSAYNMNFGYGFTIIFSNYIHHLFDTQLPTLIALRIQSGIRTECAGKYTNIRRLDMKIPVKICFISMKRFTFKVRQRSCIGERGFFKKQNSFFKKNPLTIY